MTDDSIRFDEFHDLEAASDTPMTEEEIEDFKDHVAVVMMIQSTTNRGAIPTKLVQDVGDHSWSRVAAYLDAYNPEPSLQENPISRATRVLGDSDEYSWVVSLLSQSGWKQEKREFERAYQDDDSFHFTVTPDEGDDE
jgi:hypothetical protein